MNRPLVLFTDETDLDPAPGRALLEKAGCNTLLADLPTGKGPQVLPDGAECAVALVVGYARVDGSLLDKLPDVKFIATMSAGVDMVDLDEARRRGISVVNLVDAATEEVAAHALTLALASERYLITATKVAANAGWTDDVEPVPRRLSDLTLGLYGFGRIAQRFATIALPTFGRVIAHDPYVSEGPEGVSLVGFDELIETSDVLSLHVPLTEQTSGSINAEVFRRMRPGGTLLNVSRGELVDHAALMEMLDSGHLRGAGLDVVHGEPPSAEDVLRHDDRVILTPHIAFLSEGSLSRYVLDPARNVLDWLRKGYVQNAVVEGDAQDPYLAGEV